MSNKMLIQAQPNYSYVRIKARPHRTSFRN